MKKTVIAAETFLSNLSCIAVSGKRSPCLTLSPQELGLIQQMDERSSSEPEPARLNE